MHVDCNESETENILIYPYYDGTLLDVMQEPDSENLPYIQRRSVLRGVAEAIGELHAKDWVHVDIKPDNVLLNWEFGKETSTIAQTESLLISNSAISTSRSNRKMENH
jgi:serine/threonine protein kinase